MSTQKSQNGDRVADMKSEDIRARFCVDFAVSGMFLRDEDERTMEKGINDERVRRNVSCPAFGSAITKSKAIQESMSPPHRPVQGIPLLKEGRSWWESKHRDGAACPRKMQTSRQKMFRCRRA